MEIVYLNSHGGLGGAERCLLDLFAGLPAEIPGARPRLVCLSRGALVAEAEKLGVPVSVLELPPALTHLGDSWIQRNGVMRWAKIAAAGAGLAPNLVALVPFARRLARLVESFHPAIIHSNSIKTHLLLAIKAPRGVPVVWHTHDFASHRPVAAGLLRIAARSASAVIANSEAVARDIARLAPQLPVAAVHNGVDTDHFKPGSSDPGLLDRLAGLAPAAPGAVRVGLVATYARWKGHRLFLEAAAKAAERLPASARFYIVGGPLYHTKGSQVGGDELRAAARELGIAERVGFIEFQNDPAAVYRALDVVVHASTAPEPFGRTIVEGMASAKPVIAAYAGGASELFHDGEEALAFPPGDAGALAALIARTASDEPLRARLGRAARAAARSRFTRERYAAGIASVYRDTLARSNGPKLVVAMGYLEDNWHSMRNFSEGLTAALKPSPELGEPYRHAPRLYHPPRWVDRRIRYPRTLPDGSLLHLIDHSYADAILTAGKQYDAVAITVHDVQFWRARRTKNAMVRERIRRGIAAADFRIAVSRATAEQMQRELSIAADAVIYPGVPVDRFPHSEKERDPHLVLHVGSSDPRKGIDRALRLLADLPEPFRLLHVGGPLEESHYALAAKLGVAARIHAQTFTDLTGLVAAYQRAALFIFPSVYEGFGIPVIEARLCGTVAIVSDAVPAIECLARDPGTHPLDFAAFDEGASPGRRRIALDTFLAAPREPLRLEGRPRFSWERCAAEYAEVYRGLLKTNAALAQPRSAGGKR
jgi:glycosyltransferase involved in cell wall biosynthesis